MQTVKHIVHSNQFHLLPNGLIRLFYVGHKYPESQWTGLVNEGHSHTAIVSDAGEVTVEAENLVQLYDVERHLLTIARMHGAHIIFIDSIKTFNSQNNNHDYCVRIKARCQRFEL